MVLNKKGEAIFLGIMVAIMVFLSLVVMIEPLKDGITLGRDSDHLDCTNSTISTGVKATCILVDLWLFYFVGAGIAISIGAIGAFSKRKG